MILPSMNLEISGKSVPQSPHESPPTMKPELYVVKIDETKYWAEDIIEKAGRIFGVYIYDKNRRVHCCELTPSYELRFIESQTEKRVDDTVYDEILRADAYSEGWRYYHCHVLEGLPALPEGGGWLPDNGQWAGQYKVTGLTSETYDEAIEEVLEWSRMCSC